MSQVAHKAGDYPGFCGKKSLGLFLDGMLVRPGLPSSLRSAVPIYKPGWGEAMCEIRVLSKNTTPCPRPVLEPRPLDLETSALIIGILLLLQERS